jgi:triosephosphate isomerase
MQRRKLIAGNWKMNGGRADLPQIAAIAKAAEAYPSVDVALCLPFTLIAQGVGAAEGMPIGAQDCHAADKGAHTGCVSATMLVEAGAELAIIGHSERRADQHETSEDVKAKAEAAIRAGLTAILCVGETEAERDAGAAEDVVCEQLRQSLPATVDPVRLVIAYEPIWAIGTGRTPTTADVAAMHAALRVQLGDTGAAMRILYGGSMNGDNAADLLALADVDGGLVGGASLTAAKFVPIIEAAAQRAG